MKQYPFPMKRCAQAATLGAALFCFCAGFSSAATEWPNADAPSQTDTHHSLHDERYLNDEAWISDIGTLLYSDPDEDGYFSGLSLSIDADTVYSTYEVYAVIDLIDTNSSAQHTFAAGTNGERLHTTRNFELYGRSATDEYRIDIDLIQNYSPGTYDLSIALIDAHDNRILDQVGANDFRNLDSLSLESEDNMTIHTPVTERPLEPPNDDIRVVEYAGSTGSGLISLFIMILLVRKTSSHRTKHLTYSKAHRCSPKPYNLRVGVKALTSLAYPEHAYQCQNTSSNMTNHLLIHQHIG